MAIGDDLRAAIATVSAQIDQELTAHLADSTAAAAAKESAAALADALALVQFMSTKLPPLPAAAPAA